MRWLRAAWRGVRWVHRRAYALTAGAGALTVFGLMVWELSRGFVSGNGVVADLAVGVLLAVMSGGLIYGSLRAIDGMYAAGILRGPR